MLRAFANGCAALTGVEAIANAVPLFREPAVRRARGTELALGCLLGTMLIGLAVLIERFDIRPVEGVTVLAQLTGASLGHGVGFFVVQIATTVLLALAANTSFGGLPVLGEAAGNRQLFTARVRVAGTPAGLQVRGCWCWRSCRRCCWWPRTGR